MPFLCHDYIPHDIGYTRYGKRPPSYPEELFARFKLPMEIIHLIIGRLQSEDIYTHTQAFPAPQHRSIALATQSAMLYGELQMGYA